MHSVAKTDCGLSRSMNQDVTYASDTSVGPLPNLYIIADGMGGEKAGDVAARKTVSTILNTLRKTDKVSVDALNIAFTTANYEVYHKAATNSDYAGMGSTCVACTCIGKVLYIANVGDSRLYLIQDKQINQVTNDHSYVEELIKLGRIKKDSEEYKMYKRHTNYVTRGMGAERHVETDFFMFEVRKGDVVLLCSDGLSDMLTDIEIFDIVKSSESLEKAADNLIDGANKKGGKDNISVILISDLEREELL